MADFDLQIKRSTTTAVPTELSFGEQAYSQVGVDRRLFIGKIDGTPEEIAGTSFQRKTSALTSTLDAIGSATYYRALLSSGANSVINGILVASEAGNPSETDDITVGYIPGSIRVNQNTGIAFSAIDTGEGAAVWQQITYPPLSNPILFQGVINCSANPNYPASTTGWLYVVSVAGKIGGASGIDVEIGDQILCTATNAGGTQAAVGASFSILQTNINGAVTSTSTSSTNNAVVLMDGTTGKIVKDSGILVSQSAIANTIIQRDAAVNVKANSYLSKTTVYENDGSTIALSLSSLAKVIVISTGAFTTPIIFTLPNATTLPDPNTDVAYMFSVKNESNYNVEIRDSTNNLVALVTPRCIYEITNLDNSTPEGFWDNLGSILTDYAATNSGAANKVVKTTADGFIFTKSIIGDSEIVTKPAAGSFFVRTVSSPSNVKFVGADPAVNGLSLPNATTLPEGYTVIIDNNYVECAGSIEIYGGNYIADPTVLQIVGIGEIVYATVTNRATIQGVWRFSLTPGRIIDGGTF